MGCSTSATPTATPTSTFAPDDLGFTLPREVAGMTFTVENIETTELRGESIDRLRDVLVPLGKGPSDLRMATGISSDSDVLVQAMRVGGVPATEIIDTILGMVMEGGTPPPDAEITTEMIDDKEVRMFRRTDPWVLMAVYAKGEAMYLVRLFSDEHEEAVPEILAELP